MVCETDSSTKVDIPGKLHLLYSLLERYYGRSSFLILTLIGTQMRESDTEKSLLKAMQVLAYKLIGNENNVTNLEKQKCNLP